MHSIDYKITYHEGYLKITGEWLTSTAEFTAKIGERGEGGNADSMFELRISGAQVEEGGIKLYGTWEREELRKTLELILKHL